MTSKRNIILSICWQAAKNSKCSMPAQSIISGLTRAGHLLDERLAARPSFTSRPNRDIVSKANGGTDAPLDNES